MPASAGSCLFFMSQPFVRTVVESRPNWVSSTTDIPDRRVEPFVLRGTPDESIATLAEIVRRQPRTRVVEQTTDRLRVEFRSFVFRFVDDVEFAAAGDRIEVLSASRVGYGDLGVNRRRVKSLRKQYDKQYDNA